MDIWTFEKLLVDFFTQNGQVCSIEEDFEAHTLKIEFCDGTVRVLKLF